MTLCSNGSDFDGGSSRAQIGAVYPRAEGPLLPQSDGTAGYLAGAQEGSHGDGLHPRVRTMSKARPGTVKVKPRQDPAHRREDRESWGPSPQIVRAVRAVGKVEHDELLSDPRCGTPHGRLHRRAVRQQDGPACQQRASRSSASIARKFNQPKPTSLSQCARGER